MHLGFPNGTWEWPGDRRAWRKQIQPQEKVATDTGWMRIMRGSGPSQRIRRDFAVNGSSLASHLQRALFPLGES